MTALTGKDALGIPFNFQLNPDPALGANQLAALAAFGTPADAPANGTGAASMIALLRFVAASLAQLVSEDAGLATAQRQADQLTELTAMEASLTTVVAALAAGVALPIGAATGALQLAGNAALIQLLAALQAPLVVKPISLASVAHSAVIAAAGQAQDLFPANANRSGWYFQNQSPGSLYLRSRGAQGVSLATLDNNSVLVIAGADFTPPKNSLHAWSVIGANSGQAFYCEEW